MGLQNFIWVMIGSALGGAARFWGSVVVAKFDMADFVGDEKRLIEERAGVLVQDKPIAADKYGAAAIEQSGPPARRLNIKASPLRFSDREGIGLPTVGPPGYRLRVESRSDLPGEFHPVHVILIPRAGARAFPRAHWHRSGCVRR